MTRVELLSSKLLFSFNPIYCAVIKFQRLDSGTEIYSLMSFRSITYYSAASNRYIPLTLSNLLLKTSQN
jgi:hypothetical protein